MPHAIIPKLKNPFPSIDLKRAYDYLVDIRERLPGQDSFDRKELLEKGLKSTENSSTGHNVLGSLSHYNLLHRAITNGKTQYWLTREAKDLLTMEKSSGEWTSLARQAATRPVVFNFLSSEFPDDKLPVGLETRLIRKYKEVTQKNVGAIIYRYKESLRFAQGVYKNDKEDALMTPAGRQLSYFRDSSSSSEMMDFPFPLSDGTQVVLTLPKILSQRDCDRITRYITALVGSLVEERQND